MYLRYIHEVDALLWLLWTRVYIKPPAKSFLLFRATLNKLIVWFTVLIIKDVQKIS